MSLYIDVDDITEVLLPDGWHTVLDTTFNIDSYEFQYDNILCHGGGQGGICSSGFTFKDAGTGAWITGPLTSIHAVKTSP